METNSYTGARIPANKIINFNLSKPWNKTSLEENMVYLQRRTAPNIREITMMREETTIIEIL